MLNDENKVKMGFDFGSVELNKIYKENLDELIYIFNLLTMLEVQNKLKTDNSGSGPKGSVIDVTDS